MTLLKWRPYGELATLHDSVSKLFEDEFYKGQERSSDSFSTWYPVTDIFETKDGYLFKLEVPGLAKEEINIQLNNNILSIKGERKADKEINEEKYHRIERFSGTFTRNFTLPRNIDNGNVNASLKDGILELKIGKQEEKKTKEIQISIN